MFQPRALTQMELETITTFARNRSEKKKVLASSLNAAKWLSGRLLHLCHTGLSKKMQFYYAHISHFSIVTLWVVVTLHLPPPFAEIRGKRGRASYSFPNKDGLHESFQTLISESDRE